MSLLFMVDDIHSYALFGSTISVLCIAPLLNKSFACTALSLLWLNHMLLKTKHHLYLQYFVFITIKSQNAKSKLANHKKK